MNYLVGMMAKQYLVKHENVEFNIYPMFEKVIHVENLQYMICHSHGIQSWMGIPWYSIERKVGKESQARMQIIMRDIERARACWVPSLYFGHFHTPFDSELYACCGSVSGTDLRDLRRRYLVHVIAELQYASGLRIAEVAALEASDLDLDRAIVQVRDGKKGSQRFGFLNDYAAEVLELYVSVARPLCATEYQRSADSERLFFLDFDRLGHVVNGELKTACARAGVPRITSHGFRHALGLPPSALGDEPSAHSSDIGAQDAQGYGDLHEDRRAGRQRGLRRLPPENVPVSALSFAFGVSSSRPISSRRAIERRRSGEARVSQDSVFLSGPRAWTTCARCAARP